MKKCFLWGRNWRHKRNCIITLGGGGKIDHGNRNFNLTNGQVRIRGKNGSNQPLIHIHTYTYNPSNRTHSSFFIYPSTTQQLKEFLGRKNIGTAFAPSPPKLRLWLKVYVFFISTSRLKGLSPFLHNVTQLLIRHVLNRYCATTRSIPVVTDAFLSHRHLILLRSFSIKLGGS